MREKLGSFATLHAAQINTNRLMEKKFVSNENAVSLSHSVHPMCCVSYPLSHHVSHVTLVSANLSLMLV